MGSPSTGVSSGWRCGLPSSVGPQPSASKTVKPRGPAPARAALCSHIRRFYHVAGAVTAKLECDARRERRAEQVVRTARAAGRKIIVGLDVQAKPATLVQLEAER